MNIRDGLSRASVPVITLVTGAPFGLVVLVVPLLVSQRPLHWTGVVIATAAGVVFGLRMAHLIRSERANMGGVVTARSINQAIASRTAPPGAVDSQWLAALEHRRRQTAHYHWATPSLLVALSCLGVFVVVGGIFAAWVGWVQVVVCGALAILYWVWSGRQLQGIADVEGQLQARHSDK